MSLPWIQSPQNMQVDGSLGPQGISLERIVSGSLIEAKRKIVGMLVEALRRCGFGWKLLLYIPFLILFLSFLTCAHPSIHPTLGLRKFGE